MKTITLDSVAPSASITKWYRESLYAMIKDMRQDIIKDVVTPYRSGLAMDGITDWIGHVIDSLVTRWQRNLDNLASVVADDFAKRTQTNYDKRLQTLLKRKGFAVQFQNSRSVQEQAQIVIGENVSLIKSIGNQYLDNVRAAVWRSVKGGYDTQGLIEQLMHIDGVSERRAKNIAKDQIAKANQAFEDARAQELGITEAIWLHSSASKVPRPSHVRANGTKYEIDKGLYLDGEWTKPSILPNCKCRKKLLINIPESSIGT